MEQEMKRKGGESEEIEDQTWVREACVDYKGRVPLRAATGAGKASLFVLAIAVTERIIFFGLSSNLIMYFTRVIHQDLKTATNNVNYWRGATTLMPLIGGFVGDVYTGGFRMVILSSILYLTGLSMLTMSQFIPILKPFKNETSDEPSKVHEAVFFVALYSIALGIGGFRPCLQSFGADQFDDDHLEERKKKMSFFNWWNLILSFALLLGTTVVVYVQDFVSWGVACLAFTIFLALTVIAFYVGMPFYRYKMRPKQNPFVAIIQVLIAAIRKRNLSCPSNPALLFEVPESQNSQGRLLSHTNSLRFLDKAAIVEEKNTEEKDSPWKLATVTRVEETKLILNAVPVWLTSLLIGACIAYGTTLYVKQAASMNLKINDSFKVPPASMLSLTAFSTLVSVPIYDRIVPILRKVTGNERGISILRRIGIGLALLTIDMVVAALVETKRLRMVGHEVLTRGGTKPVTMHVMWLIPQYSILGIGNSFYLTGLQEYFYHHVPDSMKSLGVALYLSGIGAGFFLSTFIINIVAYVTEINGKGWIAKDVNSSRLDKFYGLVAGLNVLNLCIFELLARRESYKTRKATEIDGSNSDGVEHCHDAYGEEMEKTEGGRTEKSEEKRVHDASVDYKGRVPLRASTGAWKAALFVLMMHEDLKTAAKNVNYWSGTTTLMPLVGGFVADAYTGRFYMVLFSSFVYLMGLSLLTMSQFIPSIKPCDTRICQQPRKVHEVLFFFSLYCISLGTGGYKPCLESFGADQFDDDHLEERKKKMSFFNWWNFAMCFALMIGATVVVYVQDFVSWGVACLIITIIMALTIITFYAGKPFYRYRRTQGNPLTPILQVLVAAIRKRNLSCPSNPALLYEVPESERAKGRFLRLTSTLSFLDKAAIIEEGHIEEKNNPWRLVTVTRVEETKLVINLVPIWLTSLTVGVCVAQGTTLFVKQAAAMNLRISDNFKIPAASMSSISAVGTLIIVPIYDRIIVPILRKVTGNERGINILTRISIGMALFVILMVVAAIVEAKRLRMATHDALSVWETDHNSMSVLWLIPQYLILGFGNSFSIVGLQEYFYDQVPDTMRSLGMGLYLSVIGTGYFLSSFLIIIVDHVTGKNGKSWIGKDINSSHLNRFYWMLAIINALNLCLFLFFAKRYTYKTVHRTVIETDGCKNDGVEIVV